jgi:hypothetical protein
MWLATDQMSQDISSPSHCIWRCMLPALLLLLLLLLGLQEIQECCKPEVLPKTSPDQLLQLFWDRQAQAAAAEASAAAAAAATPAATPVRAETAGTPGAAAGTAAAGPAAAATAGQAALSRYRSDFQELHPLGRGGFGVVVAAINRCGWCIEQHFGGGQLVAGLFSLCIIMRAGLCGARWAVT